MVGSGLILGIESSCDETAAAVVRGGREVLSNVVASQVGLHAAYGGVVPELASREHLRTIVPTVRAAMQEAGVGLGELEAVAVTEGPGLAGALLVGITYAKGLAWGLGLPLVGVNHLEGHIWSVLMGAGLMGAGVSGKEKVLALVVSGGHTHLYVASFAGGGWIYRNVGRTVDDAAGEAYDKVAKLLGLPYPGGPWMDRLAAYGDRRAVRFQFHAIDPRVGETERRFDFSFSGIKSAVMRYVAAHGMAAGVAARAAAGGGVSVEEMAALCDAETLGVIASFQEAVVGVLVRQTFQAAAEFGVRTVLVSGGVAANGELRRRFAAEGAARGMDVLFPGRGLATDNAAMIAAAGWGKYLAGERADGGVVASPGLRLG